MADIQYLNYGDQQIEKQALINDLADNVHGYVQKQPWSKKRKDKFMSAYSDIMSRGLLGASVGQNGIWGVDIEGGKIDLEALPKKDREMYREAAWFIRHQMDSLSKSNISKKEEEEPKDLTKFDNDYFMSGLRDYIRNNMFGGSNDFKMSDWNNLDPRNEYGIRERSKRADAMAKILEDYSEELAKKTDYDFEGTPFKNIDDFKAKIKNAADALRSEDTSDDNQALWQLGIRESDWFNNGSGDLSKYTINGVPVTNGDYYNYSIQRDAAAAALKGARAIATTFKHKPDKEEQQQQQQQQISSMFDNVRQWLGNLTSSPEGQENTEYGNDVSLYADISSMIGDLISMGGGNANLVGSTVSLTSDLVSDIARGENLKTILGHGLSNIGLAIAGNISGIKVKRLARRASKIYSVIYPIITAADTSVQETWEKLLSGQSLDNKDIENLKWTLHAVTGSFNSTRDTFARRKLNKQLGIENKLFGGSKAKREVKVETIDANENRNIITKQLTQKQVNRINRAGMRGGNTAANREFARITGGQPVEGQLNFGNKGRRWYNISRYVPSIRTGDAQLLKGQPAINRNAAQRAYTQSIVRLNSGWHPFGANTGFNILGRHKIFDNLGFRINKRFSDPSGRRTLSYLDELGYVPSNVDRIPRRYESGQTGRRHIGDSQWEKAAQIEKQYKDFVIDRHFTNEEPKLGNSIIGDTRYTLEQEIDPTKGYKLIIQKADGSGTKTILSEQSVNDIKNKFADAIASYRNVNRDFQKWAKVVQEIGKLGYLRRGGKVDEQINNFLKTHRYGKL